MTATCGSKLAWWTRAWRLFHSEALLGKLLRFLEASLPPWGQTTGAAAVIASVAAYETPNPSPWVFALQVVLCICGFLIPTKVTLVADGNWPAPTHNYNFVTGTNHLGLDTSADGDAAVRDFWMKMGDLLCCWCSVRGGRDSIPTVGSSRNEKHQKRGSWDFRWTERLKHRCRSIFGRTLTTSICKAWRGLEIARLSYFSHDIHAQALGLRQLKRYRED